MNASNQKPLHLSLIKDDLIHSKLLLGLNALSLQTDDFVLQLSETVFELMGIENDERGEALFEQYLEMREQVVKMEMRNLEREVEGLAERIYDKLKKG